MKLQLAFYLTIFTVSVIFLIKCFSVNAQSWMNCFDEAKYIAQKEGKQILMVFQCSEKSESCLKIERDILNSGVFCEYAKSHLIVFKVGVPVFESRVKTKCIDLHKRDLVKQYNTEQIFPYTVLLDDKGIILGTVDGLNAAPEEYIKALKKVMS